MPGDAVGPRTSLNSTRADQFLQEVGAEFASIGVCEPDEIRQLRTGSLEGQPGSYGQYFGTWDIAHGMLRDFAYYGAFSLLRIARLDREAKLSMLCDEMFEPYTNYLGFSGFPTLEKLSLQLRAVLRENDHDTSERCISAFVMYLNRLYAWAHHFFPWNLGDHFKYPTTLTMAPEGAAPTADTLAFDGPEIRLTWKALGISVRAILAETLNPELVADITAALPFTILQQHSVVTGESIFGWGAPIASTAPVRVREEIRLAPIGRLRFSQRTGQKLIIQYGPTTETILAPVLGGVVEEDVHLLDALGRAVWENTYRAKRPIFLEVTTS